MGPWASPLSLHIIDIDQKSKAFFCNRSTHFRGAAAESGSTISRRGRVAPTDQPLVAEHYVRCASSNSGCWLRQIGCRPASRLWQPMPSRPQRYCKTHQGQAGCLESGPLRRPPIAPGRVARTKAFMAAQNGQSMPYYAAPPMGSTHQPHTDLSGTNNRNLNPRRDTLLRRSRSRFLLAHSLPYIRSKMDWRRHRAPRPAEASGVENKLSGSTDKL